LPISARRSLPRQLGRESRKALLHLRPECLKRDLKVFGLPSLLAEALIDGIHKPTDIFFIRCTSLKLAQGIGEIRGIQTE